MFVIKIKNLRYEKPQNPWDVRVDRSSYLGNRFVMRSESDRCFVCDRYGEWFSGQLPTTRMQNELDVLKKTLLRYGKLNLFCWCYPKKCHAETIRHYLLNWGISLKGE